MSRMIRHSPTRYKQDLGVAGGQGRPPGDLIGDAFAVLGVAVVGAATLLAWILIAM